MRWLPFLSLLLGACSVSPGDSHDRVQAARACTATADCALTEARGCICPSAVNASKVAELNGLLAKVDCGEVRSNCAEPGRAQCVEGRCTMVKEPEPAAAPPPAVRPQLISPRGLPSPVLPGKSGRTTAPFKLR